MTDGSGSPAGEIPRERGGGAVPGELVISDRAIADIVGLTVLECYGIVGMASPTLRRGVAALLSHDRLHQGIMVDQEGDRLDIRLYLVVEQGLNVAEVAANVSSQVSYNVERMIKRPISNLEIHVQGVKAGE